MGLGVFDLIDSGNLDTLLLPYTLGMLAAGIVTYFSYKWLSKLVQNGKLWKFSIYCFFLSTRIDFCSMMHFSILSHGIGRMLVSKFYADFTQCLHNVDIGSGGIFI